MDINRAVLSRTLGDVGVMIAALIPWNAWVIGYGVVLGGITVNEFIPYTFLPMLCPIISMIHNFAGVINTKCCKMLKSVDRPLEVISVNDICKNAGISRQTFYNHFESKYMLRSWWSEYCEQFSLDRIGIDLSWEEASIRYAQLMLSPGNFIFKSASKQ